MLRIVPAVTPYAPTRLVATLVAVVWDMNHKIPIIQAVQVSDDFEINFA